MAKIEIRVRFPESDPEDEHGFIINCDSFVGVPIYTGVGEVKVSTPFSFSGEDMKQMDGPMAFSAWVIFAKALLESKGISEPFESMLRAAIGEVERVIPSISELPTN